MTRFLAAALCLLAGPVLAATQVAYTAADNISAVPVTNSNPLPVSSGGNSGTPTETSVSCGTSSTTLLAANAATKFILIKIPASAANAVWFSYATTAVTAPPSFDMAAGSAISWSTSGFLPTGTITCIGTGAVTVTVVYQ